MSRRASQSARFDPGETHGYQHANDSSRRYTRTRLDIPPHKDQACAQSLQRSRLDNACQPVASVESPYSVSSPPRSLEQLLQDSSQTQASPAQPSHAPEVSLAEHVQP